VNHVTLYGSVLYIDFVFGFYGLNLLTQQLTGWDPNPIIETGGFTSLFRDVDKIYIAGPFENIGPYQRPYIAQTYANTGQPTNWNAGFTFLGTPFIEQISSISRLNEKLIVTGGFQENTSQSYPYIAVYDTLVGQLLEWNPSPDGPVWISYTLDGRLLLGGEFSEISGTFHPGLALYDFTTEIEEPELARNIRCSPNPVDDQLTILDENGEISQILIYNSGGVVMNTIRPNQIENSISLDVSNLPAGLYCFRFLNRKNAQIASEKIIIR
jgi:hypothetical protein